MEEWNRQEEEKQMEEKNMQWEEKQVEELNMQEVEEQMGEIYGKGKKMGKGIGKGWFEIGSWKRAGMALLSYGVILVFVCCSFLGGLSRYWFSGETAGSYEKTERVTEKLDGMVEKAAPAVREFLSGEIYDDRVMVEIYSGEDGDFSLSRSYTCEEGAKVAGFAAEGGNGEAELNYVVYDRKEGRFLYPVPQSHYARQWELLYEDRGAQEVQKYYAVSADVLKEWMVAYGEQHGDMEEYPLMNKEDWHWIKCNYSAGGEITYLCYSEKQDRFCIFTGDGETMTRKKFSVEKTVYFPVSGVEVIDDSVRMQFLEHSENDLYLPKEDNDEENEDVDADGKEGFYPKRILAEVPFFNLKTILYEAGKGYYHQKALMEYIDRKTDGFLWQIEWGDGDAVIGNTEESFADDVWVYQIKYDETNAKESSLASLFGLKEYPAGSPVTVKIAFPQSSLEEFLWTGNGNVFYHGWYYLEKFVFQVGKNHVPAGALGAMAVIMLAVWGYLMVRLLFQKKGTGKEAALSKIDAIPLEAGLFLGLVISIFVILFTVTMINDWQILWNMPLIACLFLAFFDVTVFYFLCYAMLASFIRRIRAKVLWKNLLVLRFLRWGKERLGKIFHGIGSSVDRLQKACDGKKKTVLFFGAYLLGSIVLGSIALFILPYGMENIWWTGGKIEILFGIAFFAGFVFLQKKALFYVLGNEIGKERILAGMTEISKGNLEYRIDTQGLSGKYLTMAQTLPKLQEGLQLAIEESLKNERMKTELITNVSHDIKTPLTSIINYVDLLKRAKPQGEHVEHYLEVLTQKSERLKHLIEDLVEASKASSGTISLEKTNLDFTELVSQTVGEFEEKLAGRNLTVVVKMPDPPVTIFADGRRMFRILENLFQNVYKYALERTRVYLDLEVREKKTAVLTLRNISAAALNISAEELTERFVRGEESRSSEGSGLGLSIAKDLVRLQGGEMEIWIDGDLFKVEVRFLTGGEKLN
jgi:signal transduction histidine kinase